VGLAAILLLAAALRFTGLAGGLRHEAHNDEVLFVAEVERMLAERDLDHRYYQYPGLMFYLLAPVVAIAEDAPFGIRADLAARGLVAACGVLGVALAWRLGRGLGGPAAGLVAALLLAVSPADVHTAHMLRPDVVLQVLALLTLLGLGRLGSRLFDDVRVGVCLGAAAALKFTGVFLVPAYLAARVLRPGPRLRGVLAAAAVAALSFALLSPYALVHAADFLAGARAQVGHHYHEQREALTGSTLWFYLGHLLRTLGPFGLGLLAVGALQGRRRPEVAGALVHLLSILAVLGTADVRFVRHLVPALGGLAAVAGLGAAGLARGRRSRLAVIGLLAALPPLAASVAYSREVALPSTRDRALDWIADRLVPGESILATMPLGVEPTRFELVRTSGDAALDRRLALEVDLVVTDVASARALVDGFDRRAVVEPFGPANGLPLVLASAPAALRPRYERVALAPEWLASSEPGADLSALLDGDPATLFRVGPQKARPRWVQVVLPHPEPIGRVELALGARPRQGRIALEVQTRRAGSEWETVPYASARPPAGLQSPTRGRSQVLLFEARDVVGVRIVYRGERGWGFADLRLDALRAGGR
jgi:hypothetical protein